MGARAGNLPRSTEHAASRGTSSQSGTLHACKAVPVPSEFNCRHKCTVSSRCCSHSLHGPTRSRNTSPLAPAELHHESESVLHVIALRSHVPTNITGILPGHHSFILKGCYQLMVVCWQHTSADIRRRKLLRTRRDMHRNLTQTAGRRCICLCTPNLSATAWQKIAAARTHSGALSSVVLRGVRARSHALAVDRCCTINSV